MFLLKKSEDQQNSAVNIQKKPYVVNIDHDNM